MRHRLGGETLPGQRAVELTVSNLHQAVHQAGSNISRDKLWINKSAKYQYNNPSLTKVTVKSQLVLSVQTEVGESPELAEDLLQLLLLQVESGASLDGELDDAGGDVIVAVTRAKTFSFTDMETQTPRT